MYVYGTTDIGDTCSESQKLVASDGVSDDRFGTAIAIHMNTVVVAAVLDNNEKGADAGAVYVYVHYGVAWSEIQKLLAADGSAGDWFGVSVAVHWDVIVVGAYYDDNEKGTNAGESKSCNSTKYES